MPSGDCPALNTRARKMEQQNFSNLHLEKFEGKPTEDGEQWLKRFEHLARLKAMSPEKQLDLMPILLKDKAWHWFSSQPQETTATMESLKAAFLKQFGPQLKAGTYAAQLFTTKQEPGQRVADYLVTVRKLAQRAQLSEELTLQAALHGLHPTIKSFMGANPPKTMEELLTKAHDIEDVQSTETQAPNTALLEAVASLTKRIDHLTLPTINSTRQVHFNEDAQQERFQYKTSNRWTPQEQYRSYEPSNPRYRQRSPSPWNHRGQSPGRQYEHSRTYRDFPPTREERRPYRRETRISAQCKGCGGECVSRTRCIAFDKRCNTCQKVGHFSRVCHSVRRSNSPR